MLSEDQLIKGCKKKDRKAQKVLYDRYSALFLGICLRYAKDRTEAEDVLQDGFVKIYMNIHQYSWQGSFEGWMKRIIVNTAITHYHKNLKHYHQQDIDEIRETRIDDNKSGSSEFTKEELFSVLKTLPPGYKMVFNLYAIEGYKHKEIAEMMDIDVNTSKSQFSRAKTLIQSKLKDLSQIKIRNENEQ